MNPISVDPTVPPPPPPQPPRSSFSCDRHPTEQFTGFCPSCLCERLTSLDNSSSNTPSSSRRPSSASATAAAAIKSLFSSNFKTNYFPPPPPAPKAPKPSAFAPQLRRTKSFSASKNETLGLSFEPQRKSCDVRVKNTLWSLFTLHDDNKTAASACNNIPSSSSSSSLPVTEIENVKICREENDDNGGDDDEIRPVEETHFENPACAAVVDVEIDSGEEVFSIKSLKPMKDHMDLHNTHVKKTSGGGIWAAASVFSKKWQKWRQKQKQKTKKQNMFARLPVEKPISRQYRETQSEIADYGFGRRSCDTDPRFSLDAGRFSLDGGRISVDDPRYSFEEPRASWDGYLLGRSFSRMAAPMVSVLEDLPETNLPRPDMVIPVEEPPVPVTNNPPDNLIPGGSTQTREYYSDSSSRRRKSLDRSNFIRKTAAAVVAEIDELKTATIPNGKVTDHSKEFRNSLRDDYSETFELGNGFRNGSSSFSRNLEKKETKKSRRWSWRIWGFIHRRNSLNEEDEEDEEKYSRRNGVERSYSESWHNMKIEPNLDSKSSRNITRSNSSVSWRNSDHHQISSSCRKSTGITELNDYRKKKKENKTTNYSYSPTHSHNGMLRFYLTPLKSSKREGKMKPNSSHSIARSVLRLY